MLKNIVSASLILLATAILVFHGAYLMALLAMTTGAVPLIGRRVTGSDDARVPNMASFLRSSRAAIAITAMALAMVGAAIAGGVAAGGWKYVPESLTAALVIFIAWAWAMKYVFLEKVRNQNID